MWLRTTVSGVRIPPCLIELGFNKKIKKLSEIIYDV